MLVVFLELILINFKDFIKLMVFINSFMMLNFMQFQIFILINLMQFSLLIVQTFIRILKIAKIIIRPINLNIIIGFLFELIKVII